MMLKTEPLFYVLIDHSWQITQSQSEDYVYVKGEYQSTKKNNYLRWENKVNTNKVLS